jgi:hypothetical protein
VLQVQAFRFKFFSYVLRFLQGDLVDHDLLTALVDHGQGATAIDTLIAY